VHGRREVVPLCEVSRSVLGHVWQRGSQLATVGLDAGIGAHSSGLALGGNLDEIHPIELAGSDAPHRDKDLLL
jgi:hypothetical protein